MVSGLRSYSCGPIENHVSYTSEASQALYFRARHKRSRFADESVFGRIRELNAQQRILEDANKTLTELENSINKVKEKYVSISKSLGIFELCRKPALAWRDVLSSFHFHVEKLSN